MTINELTNGFLNDNSSLIEIIRFFKGDEIACDFIPIKENELESYNEIIDNQYIKKRLYIFAITGSGDLWLIDQENSIFFYDHNAENITVENIINTGINIYQ